MIHLLIIADDFTGALDTGVQFAAHNIKTRVVVDLNVDFTGREAGVLVVDTESRHLPAEKAFEVVAGLTRRALCAGVSCIYKKTDSALRGNIGAELAAVMTAGGLRQLPFLPAFPQIGRITRGGIHYVDGVPVDKSPFGQDPFEPVKHSAVTELIEEQWALPARSFPALKAGDSVPRDEGILVFDAADTEELCRTGRQLLEQGGMHILAGCAGFGTVLPELLGIAGTEARPLPILDPRLLVVCGSVNSITLAQLDKAESAGFTRLRLDQHQKLEPGYWQSGRGRAALIRIEELLAASPRCIIETNDCGSSQSTMDYAAGLGIDRETMRLRIAGSLGSLAGEIFTSPSLGTLLLTGGDTLLQCMNCIGVRELEPLCELEKGVVLAGFTYKERTRYVITKSGGFGQESLLIDLAERIARRAGTGGKE